MAKYYDSRKQLVEGYVSQPRQEAAQTGAMPMTGSGDNAEPDFMRTTPERGHQYIYDEAGLSRDVADAYVANNIEAATNDLNKAKKGEPKMGTSLAKYNAEKAAWQEKVNKAQAAVDFWNGVKAAQDKRIAKERETQRERETAACYRRAGQPIERGWFAEGGAYQLR